MSYTNYWVVDYDLSSPAPPSFPRGPAVLQPVAVGQPEQTTALCFVGLLLLLLLFLLVRCIRILLDPYKSMPASSWTERKEGLDRGQFDYALV
ncbi:cortexin-1 [Stigmatopora nigra]